MSRHFKVALVAIALMVIAFAALVGLRVRYEHFTVPGDTMTPTISRGDLLLADRWTYGYAVLHGPKRLTEGRMPRRGEVVVVHKPDAPQHRDLLERVIAVGGDRLAGFEDGHLELNGAPIPRCNVGALADPDGRPAHLFIETLGSISYAVLETDGDSQPPFQLEVPAGRVFVMGDARAYSGGSRVFGTLSKRALMGRVVWDSGGGRTGHDPESPIVPVAMQAAAARCLAWLHSAGAGPGPTVLHVPSR